MSSNKKPDQFDKVIAQRLRLFRMNAGLSQTELANKLGITFQQIQKYEGGINRVGSGRLYQLARILKLPVSVFFPEQDSPADSDEYAGNDSKQISEFALSAEGWKLCKAFLEITNPGIRASIVRLVQEVAKEPSDIPGIRELGPSSST